VSAVTVAVSLITAFLRLKFYSETSA
jgi:hypothetical protein